MRRRIVSGLVALLVAAVLVYTARRPLLVALGGVLVDRDLPRPADAIVVLSGSIPDRILEAVDLYNAHFAPRIILTREAPLPGLDALRAKGVNLPEPHEQNRSVAEQLGVPARALTVMDAPTTSTIAEAAVLVAYLREQQVRSMILVTSKAHARRAGMIFRHLGGEDLDVTVCPSRYDPFDPETWWQHRAFVRRVLGEYAKLLNYLCIDRWRTIRAEGAAP